MRRDHVDAQTADLAILRVTRKSGGVIDPGGHHLGMIPGIARREQEQRVARQQIVPVPLVRKLPPHLELAPDVGVEAGEGRAERQRTHELRMVQADVLRDRGPTSKCSTRATMSAASCCVV